MKTKTPIPIFEVIVMCAVISLSDGMSCAPIKEGPSSIDVSKQAELLGERQLSANQTVKAFYSFWYSFMNCPKAPITDNYRELLKRKIETTAKELDDKNLLQTDDEKKFVQLALRLITLERANQ